MFVNYPVFTENLSCLQYHAETITVTSEWFTE